MYVYIILLDLLKLNIFSIISENILIEWRSTSVLKIDKWRIIV